MVVFWKKCFIHIATGGDGGGGKKKDDALDKDHCRLQEKKLKIISYIILRR